MRTKLTMLALFATLTLTGGATATEDMLYLDDGGGVVTVYRSNGCGCNCTFRIYDPKRSLMDGTPSSTGNYVTSKASIWCNKTVQYDIWGRWWVGGIPDLTEPQIIKYNEFFPLKIDTSTGIGVTRYYTLHMVMRQGTEYYRSRWNVTIRPVVCGPPLLPIDSIGSNEVKLTR